jgi:tetratricopeptide (TPR) repeat protein
MIKVETLRLRGLCASSLLALAACSGTQTNSSQAMANSGPAMGEPSPAPVVNDLAAFDLQDPQERPSTQALLEGALKNARRSLESRLFEDARNEAAFALELDNQNAEAREILRRCNEVLGDRVATVGGRFADEILRNRIAAERDRTLVERELEQASAHMQQGSYGRAIESYQRALATLRLSPHFQPNDPLLLRTQNEYEAANQRKLEADKQTLASMAAASKEELDRIAKEQQESKEDRVARLLEDANKQFLSGQYDGSVERIDQALMIDPTNQAAIDLREIADRARHNSAMEMHRERWRQEWNATILENQQSNVAQTETVVFDPIRWAEVSQRQQASFTAATELDSPENRAIAKKLDEQVLEHNFPSATVQDWAAYYGNLTGVTFVVGPDVAGMDATATTLTDFRLSRRSVADALKVIQAQTGVAYRVRNGLVQLVTPENAIGNLYYDRYNVSDLVTGFRSKPGADLKLKAPDDDSPLFPEVDEDPAPAVVDDSRLQDILKEAVAAGRWDGSPFTMNFQAGMLLVRADKETHEGVLKLLRDLRRNVGIQVDVESRFLKVEDNFLEDVGVDLRGLGNQASQGVAGRGLENRTNAGFDDFGPSQQQNPATPGLVGTGTEPGIFFDDGNDGDYMGRAEHLFDRTLGGSSMNNAGGMSLQYAFLDDVEVEAVLRAVSKQERSEQIEAPRLLIYNNTRASMHVLNEISYIKDFEVEIAQAAGVANPVIGTVYDGVSLDVRPVVDSDLKFITMELRPTVMSLSRPIPNFTTTLGVGQPISIQLPEVALQRVRTTVTLPDGATMMLGGMRLVERQNLVSGVPVLKDLPGLSFLFSRKGTSLQNRKILILIKANIVIMEELQPETSATPDSSVAAK